MLPKNAHCNMYNYFKTYEIKQPTLTAIVILDPHDPHVMNKANQIQNPCRLDPILR